MDIGIMITATAQTGDIAEIAHEVENLGFESFFIPEHPVIPIDFKTVPPYGGGNLPEHYGRWMDPFIALSVAAAVTRRVKLGTGICLFPEREPIVTAKLIATLDVISGGRVVLGVGAGWLREETEVFGVNFLTRWKLLRESTEAMRVLWTEKECSYRGDLVRFPPVRFEPKPVQKPYPPILLGAIGPKALERVARTYDGWCPAGGKPEALGRDVDTIRKLAAERGRDPKSIRIEPFVAPSDEGITLDELKRYKDAGVDRLILFSQRDAVRIAHGRALEVVRRLAPIVERAQHA